MTEACAGRIKKSHNAENFGVCLCYVPDMLSTCYRHASNVKRASHTCLGHITEAISRKSERECYFVSYTGMLKACTKHIQRVFNASVMRMELIHIRHMPKAGRASRKPLSMFKNLLNPNAPGTHTDLQQDISTYTKRTKRVFLACLRCAPEVC